MKDFWRALVNLLLYGHFWIAAAALGMYLQSEKLLTGTVDWGLPHLVVGSGTLCLYALHRVVGLQHVTPFRDQGRFRVIARYRWHIIIYLAGFGLVAFVSFLQLPRYLQYTLAGPCVLALAYVLPVFGSGRRLRDLHYVKIFLIAIAWAWITVAVPARAAGLLSTFPAWLMIGERACFIFAITLPFDLRDREVDRFTGVKTIPAVLGVARTKKLAISLLVLSAGWAALNTHLGTYSTITFTALIISFLSTSVLIWRTRGTEQDYHYTGWIDGTMILQFILVLLAQQLR